MIFADKRNYGIVESGFNGKYKLFTAFLDSIRDGNRISPFDATSVDKSKSLLVIKAFNEHSERALMGAQSHGECLAINFIDGSIHKLNKRDFAYGFNERFGSSDTTGTASGHVSEMVIKKAVLELIEKNELFMLWYGAKGFYVELCCKYRNLIDSLEFINSFVDIFLCRRLSNYFTAIVIVKTSTNTKIVASGIAISNCMDEAISLALQEARLMEWAHHNNIDSIFYKLSDENHLLSIDHLEKLKLSLWTYNAKFNYSPNLKQLKIHDLVKSIYFRAINVGKGKRELTVKCVSDELFNCLPRNGRIALSMNKEIVKHIGLDKCRLNKIPDCVLL